ncbi:apolipoprotein N-acyltransferase [Povalibacter uvarum]|uniref:Apolipoprotein N-acyltransferase n=1 Tax=Povalibacter uvarum TaxID=732238 RepID=A0A841HK88_9GAMM|nr:iron uptake protein [Povalibacter uvarum]MBB6092542.1 apolipoprotein N-acyltransferase [Povalibacter uvarum]
MSASAPSLSPLHIALRIIGAVGGGWLFVWGFTTLGIALGIATGMPYDEARTLLYLLAFVVFLVAFCWSFVTASIARVWLVLAGGGAVMTGGAWLLLRSIA